MPPVNRLLMKGIRKEYPGVCALDDVDFEVVLGEVHALVGVNGAGKSTLIKILAGATRMDRGSICLDGEELELSSPHDAMEQGISVIYQEFNLVPELTAAENIFLGREPRNSLGFVNRKKMYKEAGDLLKGLGALVEPGSKVFYLGIAHQQLVEVAKALALKARVIAMDEPTATLSLQETERLFSTIKLLKREGKGIIFISHRIEEIFQIADRVTVLRDGKLIGTHRLEEVNRDTLIEMMLGKALEKALPRREVAPGREVLRVEGLGRKGVLEDIDLSVREGEILGIAGLVGAGKTELARAIFGLDPIDEGRLFLGGAPRRLYSPTDAIRAGVVLVPEDRKRLGLVLEMAVRENISLAALPRFARLGFVNKRDELGAADGLVKGLMVKTPSIEQLVKNLSGGNQQKVVLAKWLLKGARVFIFDEPTRGIDVGAKREIYQLINDLTQQGIAVIMISSELEEVINLSDRIIVMHAGRIMGELSREEASPDRVLFLAMGGK